MVGVTTVDVDGPISVVVMAAAEVVGPTSMVILPLPEVSIVSPRSRNTMDPSVASRSRDQPSGMAAFRRAVLPEVVNRDGAGLDRHRRRPLVLLFVTVSVPKVTEQSRCRRR